MRLERKPTEVQTLIFPKEKFGSAAAAKKWATDHDYKAPEVDETEDSYRLRQRDPGEFSDRSFRTIDLPESGGVKAVIGKPKEMSFHGPAIKFDGLPVDGQVRTGVWDRICVPGRNVKDGEETIFDRSTLTQMVDNFARRGDMVMLDWNHQSSFTHENGQPAPALGFYGALCVVFDRQLAACHYARGVAETPPDATVMDDGLWGLRSEVTMCGQELLPGFRYLSPTFTPEGVDQEGRPVGYSLLAVAATNTPWQAGTQITFETKMGRATTASIDRGDYVQHAQGWWLRAEQVSLYVVSGVTSSGEHKEIPVEYIVDVSRVKPEAYSQSGAKIMSIANAAKAIGLEPTADRAAIRKAYVARFEGEAAKAAMEEAYNYDEAATALEEMARHYEDAKIDEEGEVDAPHVTMRKMAAKFRKLGKMGDPPFGGKETPSEEAAEGHKMEKDDEEDKKMEADDEDKKAMQVMARRLGLPLSAGARQIAVAMEAKTASLDKVGVLEKRLAELEDQRQADLKAERRRAAQVTFEQAVSQGRTKEEKRDAFMGAYSRDPREAETLLFAPGTFPGRGVLMSRMTQSGAPLGVEARDSSTSSLDQRIVTMSALGTNAKAVVFGENLSKAVINMADSSDPKVRDQIDRELGEGTKGTKYESYERYLAAERLLKRERPDLFQAAREDAI